MAKKIEMLNDQQEVVHPLTSSDCVIMENGKTLEEVMGDGIATPTVTHEGASFQVGVGDSNIEVVDGDVAGMTLEGQTYQNILPKPTTLIMETDEKEFKINDKIDNNIVLDDNVAEIATIKGQTYVNAVQEESASEYVAIGEELNGQSITTTGKPEGYVKNATLEGLTLVNTIQEPSRADATVLELDADIDAQTATIDNTVQGGIHGATLEGQTLVNIIKKPISDNVGDSKIWRQQGSGTPTYKFNNDGSITVTSSVNGSMVLDYYDLSLFKPNTVYTLFIDVNWNGVGVAPNLEKPSTLNVVLNNGLNIVKFTTVSDLSVQYMCFRLGYAGGTLAGCEYTFNNIMVLEGDHTQEDIPYFEGMKSVEVPSVKTTGKNLFDIRRMNESGGIKDNIIDIQNNSVTTNNDNSATTGKGYTIRGLKKNTPYKVTVTNDASSRGTGNFNISSRDGKVWYSQRMWGIPIGETRESIVYTDTGFLGITINTNGNYNVTFKDIQIEEGSTSTSYEPYQSSTLTCGKINLDSSMIEQGSFYDSYELNTQTYQYIKVPSTADDFYVDRIRSKGTYKVFGGDKYSIKLNSGYAIIFGFCKNGLYSAKTNGWNTSTETTITVPNGCDEMFFAIKKTSEATINPSEFSNVGLEIRHTVTLRKVGDVQDELDLETGRLTQRIGEVVLDGSENYWYFRETNDITIRITNDSLFNAKNLNCYCDILNVCSQIYQGANDVECLCIRDGLCGVGIRINKSKLTSFDETGFKQWLSQNPITVQYELSTPIIRQVDLSIVDQSNNQLKTIQAQPTLTHITTSSNGLIPFVSIPSQLKYPTIIKPSTQYTLKLKRDVVDSANQLTVNIGGVSTSVTSNVMTITTPDTLTSQDIVFTGKNNVVSKLQLIEGDVASIDYPFFEGMSDVKSPKLLATGKNLFDLPLIQKQSYVIEFDANSITVQNDEYNISELFGIKHKPNEQYTIIYDREDISGLGVSLFAFYYTDGSTQYIEPGIIGVSSSSKTLKYIALSFSNIGVSKLSNICLVRGVDNNLTYEPYKDVTIEQDIDSIPLTSDMFEQGGINAADSTVINGISYQQTSKDRTNPARIMSKQLIKVKPNAKYSINYQGFLILFDKNGSYIKIEGKTIDFTPMSTFTIPSNAYYIALCLRDSNINNAITPSSLDSLNLIIQEVPQEIVLRSIGDIKDTLNLTTGEYVQRIGEVVLDGSNDEDWFLSNEDGYTNKRFRTECLKGIFLYSGGTVCNIICDKVPCYSNSTWRDDREGIEHDNIYISFRKNFETITEFKQYLSQNPITVQYVLATPIITKVNLTNTTKLPSYNSTTHYDTIVPSNSLVPNIKIPSTIDYNVAIKPSTEYTVRCNTTNAMSVDLGGSVGTLTDGKVTLTTPSTLAHNSLKLGNGKAKEVMVIEGSEIKDNVPFFNGMKNVQMGGIKLVNIARGATCNSYVTANANKTQFTYTADGTNWGKIQFDKTLLKPNTKYTIRLNVVSNCSSIKVQLGHAELNFYNINNGVTGVINGTIITPPNIKCNVPSSDANYFDDAFCICFRNAGSGQQSVISNPMIFEGDWTHLDEIPYIESEMIIEQPIIRSQGKNLFDVNKLVQDTNGSNFNSGGYRFPLINFEVGKTYTISVSESKWIKIGEFSAGVTIVENFNTTKLTITITNDLLKSYIMVNNSDCSVITDVEWLRNNIQIEEGSSATTYEPFKQHTLSSNRVIGYEEGVHYAGTTGIQYTNASYNSVLADVEGLSIAYVTNASSNFSFWDKDMVFISGKAYLDTSLSADNKNGFIQVPSNAKYIKFASGNNSGSATNYTKAAVTGELPLRSLPSGVCDSFNLVTGEYVQRVGEVVLDGSQQLSQFGNEGEHYYAFNAPIKTYTQGGRAISDKLSTGENENWGRKYRVNPANNLAMLCFSLDGYMTKEQANVYLSQNPITVQYELETPIVRKIGLTAKGNYKEVELNGSENWTGFDKNYGCAYTLLANKAYGYRNVFADKFATMGSFANLSLTISGTPNNSALWLSIGTAVTTLDEFKQWLSQNPVKVGYLTTNSASLYTNIQKPIFFDKVNIQFMNNNMDIQPSLTLQARSRNSYVMDMMKPNTRYTLKALKNSNPFTIDGTSYSVGTNGTFTSPFTLTNKLMITGQDVYELMIIEGDITGLTIPYYKGIRSAYDDVDRVEIYSSNENLFDDMIEIGKIGIYGNNEIATDRVRCINYIKLTPNKTYYISCNQVPINRMALYDINKNLIRLIGTVANEYSFTTSSNEVYCRFDVQATSISGIKIKIEFGNKTTPYQPHKENTTSFPMPTRLETVDVVRPEIEIGKIAVADGTNNEDATGRRSKDYIPVEPNMVLTFMNGNSYRAENVYLYDINKNYISAKYTDGSGDLIIPKDCYFIKFYSGSANTSDITVIKQQYKPIALNSLPNGVKDELIINRATSSAKLIQRVGKVVLDGSEDWKGLTEHNNNFRAALQISNMKYEDGGGNSSTIYAINDKLPTMKWHGSWNTTCDAISCNTKNIHIHLANKHYATINLFKEYLKRNPITVYYELAQPVVTEIQLKGYPSVYKDGSVQLNTEIPHTTKVKYNVNQEHLINGQNETIIRHDKQIDNLYDYIELYLEEEYRMELFRMQLELSL